MRLDAHAKQPWRQLQDTKRGLRGCCTASLVLRSLPARPRTHSKTGWPSLASPCCPACQGPAHPAALGLDATHLWDVGGHRRSATAIAGGRCSAAGRAGGRCRCGCRCRRLGSRRRRRRPRRRRWPLRGSLLLRRRARRWLGWEGRRGRRAVVLLRRRLRRARRRCGRLRCARCGRRYALQGAEVLLLHALIVLRLDEPRIHRRLDLLRPQECALDAVKVGLRAFEARRQAGTGSVEACYPGRAGALRPHLPVGHCNAACEPRRPPSLLARLLRRGRLPLTWVIRPRSSAALVLRSVCSELSAIPAGLGGCSRHPTLSVCRLSRYVDGDATTRPAPRKQDHSLGGPRSDCWAAAGACCRLITNEAGERASQGPAARAARRCRDRWSAANGSHGRNAKPRAQQGRPAGAGG